MSKRPQSRPSDRNRAPTDYSIEITTNGNFPGAPPVFELESEPEEGIDTKVRTSTPYLVCRDPFRGFRNCWAVVCVIDAHLVDAARGPGLFSFSLGVCSY